MEWSKGRIGDVQITSESQVSFKVREGWPLNSGLRIFTCHIKCWCYKALEEFTKLSAVTPVSHQCPIPPSLHVAKCLSLPTSSIPVPRTQIISGMPLQDRDQSDKEGARPNFRHACQRLATTDLGQSYTTCKCPGAPQTSWAAQAPLSPPQLHYALMQPHAHPQLPALHHPTTESRS